MLKAVFAVVEELTEFWYSSFRLPITQVFSDTTQRSTETDQLLAEVATLNNEVEQFLGSSPTAPLLGAQPPPLALQSAARSQAVSAEEKYQWLDVPLYTTTAKTSLYKSPNRWSDNQIERLQYATKLRGGERTGQFVSVSQHDGVSDGWVLVESVTDTEATVFPHFFDSQYYDAANSETHKLRQLLDDDFANRALNLPLQANEYVAYRLQQAGRTVLWPKKIGRLAGQWHQILRGQTGVHSTIVPQAQSVMETILDPSAGRLAYVEAVYPDESISICEVADGIYRERSLTADEWRELRPVFISIV